MITPGIPQFVKKRFRHAPPRAAAMIEALRGLGYSAATALADIIDNSIAANATSVALTFRWDGAESAISILDNGEGMNAEMLDRAMRLGEINPLAKRGAHDLGRFGLGLKTASFSQCRRLTVASRRDGSVDCLHWDLDVIAASTDDGWHLLEGPHRGSEARLRPLDAMASGTLVLWENLDRIVTPGCTEQEFLDLIDRVQQHLAMVFHRFLSGPSPRLRLTINRRSVSPWNPFMPHHPATWSSPVERIATNVGLIEVQCHVLPHKDRLDAREHESMGGPEGWTSQQGFYVYRNERLLVAGGWLGLGRGRAWTKEESHRLARIRLDIPNTADMDWKIDIRKSTARPPLCVRERLTRLADDTRARARRVFAHRGQTVRTTVGGNSVVQAWVAEHFSGGVRYRIDSNHPAVTAVLENAGELEPDIRAMLRVIQETIPVQRIWLDTAEGNETPRTAFAGAAPNEVRAVLAVMYRNLVIRRSLSPEQARLQLLHTDPFQQYPDLVAGLPDTPCPA